jgi:3-phenylpropionate/trans-cinnamate dioxygenase ferredoxin reductase subunit
LKKGQNMTDRCIIIGASHAAAQLVPSLRQEGWQGEIVIVGDEPHLPYHRPPLSKAFLSGEKTAEELPIRPAAFYDKNEATLYHGYVRAIDRVKKSVLLENGDVLSYDKLVLCTGARVRKINVPGAELGGVHYLRNIADVEGIQAHIATGKNAVIIGGGYIGLETAASLTKQGMQVVVLEMAERILQRVTPPEVSSFYARIHAEEGVEIKTNVQVTQITGEQTVQSVLCDDGQTFPADVVIVGVGVIPNVELAEQAGLEVNNGIRVNAQCVTTDPNIFAAGDCTNHFNDMYDCQLRLESVPNANEQAKVAAASICDNPKIYNSLPWFWSDQYDLKLQIAGLSRGFDHMVVRGDQDKGRSFAAFYYKEGRLIAADCVNRPKEFMLSKKMITQRSMLAPELLCDESVTVKALIEQLR